MVTLDPQCKDYALDFVVQMKGVGCSLCWAM